MDWSFLLLTTTIQGAEKKENKDNQKPLKAFGLEKHLSQIWLIYVVWKNTELKLTDFVVEAFKGKCGPSAPLLYSCCAVGHCRKTNSQLVSREVLTFLL